MPTPRILVADDNPLSLRFLAEAVTMFGFECVEAADGAEALACAQREAFDLLLLDARMPGHGGAEVLARIGSAAGPSQHAIALASTADDAPETAAALRRAGFAAVLPKPLTLDTLRDALATHVALPCAADAEQAAPIPSPTLDDQRALAAAGGDDTIVAALRGLFLHELDALPAELAAIAARRDAAALRERLHRLDASAGFCGAPALPRAAALLRQALEAPAWPQAALADFLAVCERTRTLLAAALSRSEC